MAQTNGFLDENLSLEWRITIEFDSDHVTSIYLVLYSVWLKFRQIHGLFQDLLWYMLNWSHLKCQNLFYAVEITFCRQNLLQQNLVGFAFHESHIEWSYAWKWGRFMEHTKIWPVLCPLCAKVYEHDTNVMMKTLQ